MRRFHLSRTEDETGISGVGKVAEGVVFSDGTVALRWTPTANVLAVSTVIYADVQAVELIHGHNGKTRIVYDDDKPMNLKEAVERARGGPAPVKAQRY